MRVPGLLSIVLQGRKMPADERLWRRTTLGEALPTRLMQKWYPGLELRTPGNK